MKIERTRNTGRNMLAGSVLKLFQMLVPFAMRTMLIYYMGAEYLGLSSLFKSVLQVLNLAELGVGSAMVYAMYKPIADDDEEMICALMRLYRTYYRVIGLVIAGVGLALTPLIPKLVNGTLPGGLNMYILYLMNLGATVLSYWLFAYRNCLLSAYQRNDIESLILLGSQVLQYALQAVIVIFFKDYYLYVLAILIGQVVNNIGAAIASKGMFPAFSPKGDLPKEKREDINRRIRDLFISKLGGVVLGSADTIVISAFLGLTVLAEYQNYFFIVSSVYGFVEVLLTAMLAGIGNSMVTESAEKNYRDMRKISVLFTLLVFGCACCFTGIFQPFMRLWMGDELMLPYGMVLSFTLFFIVYEFTRLFNTFKNAAGEWHQDRFRPLISAVTNLCLNLLTIRFLGLYGIIWSSVAALLFVEIPWLLRNIFSTVYRDYTLLGFLKEVIVYLLGGAAAWALTALATVFLPAGGWGVFFLSVFFSVLIPCVLFLLMFRRLPVFREAMALMDKMTRYKLPIKRLMGE